MSRQRQTVEVVGELGRSAGGLLSERRAEGIEDSALTACNERELATAFKDGAPGAYEEIFDRYRKRVDSVCRRMLGDAMDAQEASQETFLRVHAGLNRFNGRYQLGSWISRIATNVCLDQLRARSRKPSHPMEAETIEALDTSPSEESDPEALAIRRSESRRVRRVLASLPPYHRAAIILRDFEGFSYCEIADALDMSESQVKALLHRARQGFKRSWVSAAMGLLPAKLVTRLRFFDQSARDATPNVTAFTNAAASCGGIIQQCGQFAAERVAPIVAVALVGTSAAVAVPQQRHDFTSVAEASVSSLQGDRSTVSASEASKKRTKARTRKVSSTATAGATSGTVPAQSQPTSGTAEPQDSPKPTPPADPTPAPTPTSPPGNSDGKGEVTRPTVPKATIGFDRGNGIRSSTVHAHSLVLDCDGFLFEQELEATVSDGERDLQGLLKLHGASSLSLALTVNVDGTSISYSGGGPFTSFTRDKSTIRFQVSGSYATGNDRARSLGLPQSGRFTANLTLDCGASAVVTESVVLATD